MAVTAQIPIGEYLHTSYRPDCDYIDGEVVERHVGKTDHARIQALLALWFGMHEQEWHILVTTEHRMRVSETRVRIPDVTLVRPGALTEDVLTHPPLCCIEILSPEDSYSQIREKCRDYRLMGVENIWLIDPSTRSGQAAIPQGWQDTLEFGIPETPIRLSLEDLFARLDRSLA
ncbi:Uma2 family endonuclease [Paracidobacterium acidisoli]|uniref:Uma2 family endonuclease n=1 Tax=Paracidobacterium acidisoli TaxID=2303751 RepID=A0A372IPC1_9BACT|nr:Uma2 family endonuclease [Paracidobacterium acidisoli]MBT9331094.1 Uma2 family endonuclease [Paracidobacterium acidisoli]